MSAANLPTVSRGFGHSAVKHIQQKKAAAAAPDVEGVGEYDVEFCAVSVSHSFQPGQASAHYAARAAGVGVGDG